MREIWSKELVLKILIILCLGYVAFIHGKMLLVLTPGFFDLELEQWLLAKTALLPHKEVYQIYTFLTPDQPQLGKLPYWVSGIIHYFTGPVGGHLFRLILNILRFWIFYEAVKSWFGNQMDKQDWLFLFILMCTSIDFMGKNFDSIDVLAANITIFYLWKILAEEKSKPLLIFIASFAVFYVKISSLILVAGMLVCFPPVRKSYWLPVIAGFIINLVLYFFVGAENHIQGRGFLLTPEVLVSRGGELWKFVLQPWWAMYSLGNVGEHHQTLTFMGYFQLSFYLALAVAGLMHASLCGKKNFLRCLAGLFLMSFIAIGISRKYADSFDIAGFAGWVSYPLSFMALISFLILKGKHFLRTGFIFASLLACVLSAYGWNQGINNYGVKKTEWSFFNDVKSVIATNNVSAVYTLCPNHLAVAEYYLGKEVTIFHLNPYTEKMNEEYFAKKVATASPGSLFISPGKCSFRNEEKSLPDFSAEITKLSQYTVKDLGHFELNNFEEYNLLLINP